jgi:hypothetical protein
LEDERHTLFLGLPSYSNNLSANKVFEAEEQAMVLNEELAAARRKLDQADKMAALEQKKAQDLQVRR